MTRLRGHTSVNCPVVETRFRLEAYFASLRAPDGVARMRLRVPINGSVNALGLSLDREVRVEAQRERDVENREDWLRITWSPEGRIVFPKFEGTLVVRGEADAALSYLELDGAYRPPLGIAGQIFDEAIGHRIAESTAGEFLKDLKRAVEARQRLASPRASSWRPVNASCRRFPIA